jgi:hypothetical protein
VFEGFKFEYVDVRDATLRDGKECHEEGPPAESCSACPRETKRGPTQLYAGLEPGSPRSSTARDVGRVRQTVCLLSDQARWRGNTEGTPTRTAAGHARSIVFGRFLAFARLSWSPGPALARISRPRTSMVRRWWSTVRVRQRS